MTGDETDALAESCKVFVGTEVWQIWLDVIHQLQDDYSPSPEISAKGIAWRRSSPRSGWGVSASLLCGAPASVPVPFLCTKVRHPEPARRPALRKETRHRDSLGAYFRG